MHLDLDWRGNPSKPHPSLTVRRRSYAILITSARMICSFPERKKLASYHAFQAVLCKQLYLCRLLSLRVEPLLLPAGRCSVSSGTKLARAGGPARPGLLARFPGARDSHLIHPTDVTRHGERLVLPCISSDFIGRSESEPSRRGKRRKTAKKSKRVAEIGGASLRRESGPASFAPTLGVCLGPAAGVPFPFFSPRASSRRTPLHVGEEQHRKCVGRNRVFHSFDDARACKAETLSDAHVGAPTHTRCQVSMR